MADDPESSEAPVRARVAGRLGRLTLNRPTALNALTLDMIRSMAARLLAWAGDGRIGTVLIDGAGTRGLCAGGDIRELRRAALEEPSAAEEFWAREYALNALLAGYPKPVVAVMDGIVMGGGVGLSAHATHRVVTGRSVVSMPEVGIGFTPDVGSTYLLSRAPGELGTYAAVTGARFDAADAVGLGLADAVVPVERLPELVGRLSDEPADAVLAAVGLPGPGPARLASARGWIDEAFAGDDPTVIRARIAARAGAPTGGDPGGHSPGAALALLDAASPTAVTVALRAVRSARALPTLRDCLVQEYRVSCGMLRAPDFPEGVRAAVVDKDRRPRWRPPSLSEVDPTFVAGCFAPRPGRELILPGGVPTAPGAVRADPRS